MALSKERFRHLTVFVLNLWISEVSHIGYLAMYVCYVSTSLTCQNHSLINAWHSTVVIYPLTTSPRLMTASVQGLNECIIIDTLRFWSNSFLMCDDIEGRVHVLY